MSKRSGTVAVWRKIDVLRRFSRVKTCFGHQPKADEVRCRMVRERTCQQADL